MTETRNRGKFLPWRYGNGDTISSGLSPKHFVAAALVAVTLLTTGTASASLTDAIGALGPGDMYRVIFMTSTTGKTESSDIGVYNQRVTDAAAAGSITSSLGLSWSALASTGAVNAQDNTGVFSTDNAAVSFFNTNGDLIATSGADLWDGTLLAAVLYDENGLGGGNVLGNYVTWSGTDELGGTLDPLGGIDVRYGFSDRTNQAWISNTTNPSNFNRSLYGVSEVTVVPIPAAAWLLGSGLVALGAIARRRKMAA